MEISVDSYFSLDQKYTGYDVLFIDYLTNMRYTLTQIMKADTSAVKIMREDFGIPLSSDSTV